MNFNRSHNKSVFYKYTSADTAKIILKTCKLRWSNPTIFNDPFDVPAQIFTSVDTAKVTREVASVMKFLIEGGELDDFDHVRRDIKWLSEASKNSDAKLKKQLMDECDKYAEVQVSSSEGLEMMQANWHKYYLNQRIVCFSERWNSASMWSHYADEHKGVVIVFKCADLLDSATMLAKPVCYSDAVLRYNTAKGLAELFFYEPDFAIRKFLHEYTHTKTTDWSYEQEWRIASFKRPDEEGNYSDYGFFAEEVEGVIFGTDISTESRDEIMDIVRGCNYDRPRFWQSSQGEARHLSRNEIVTQE